MEPAVCRICDESGTYRATVDGANGAAAYYMNHDVEVACRLSLIGTASLRGKVIADIGCGAGSFLAEAEPSGVDIDVSRG